MSESIEKKRRSCPKRRRSPERQCILPISSLVGMALQQWDSERSWDAIHELRLRATPETVERCQKMFRSRNWRKRALAINVMCQLQQRLGRWKSADYAVYQAHSMLRAGLRDPHSQVVAAAAFGCGHRRNADDTALLIALASHASADVRLGVAFGLCFHEDERAVDTLIQLAGDRDTRCATGRRSAWPNWRWTRRRSVNACGGTRKTGLTKYATKQ